MKVSHRLLQTFFTETLPSPDAIAEALTFHSWEIEEVIPLGSDTILDVKVLPDKASWALSHRGIAKDISTVLGIPMDKDTFAVVPDLQPTGAYEVSLQTEKCDRYIAGVIDGVVVKESPEWLKEVLVSLGQRSINTVVDATNYVMFMTGQPLHAFDADLLSGKGIVVRNAHEGETITTLDDATQTLSASDVVITDKGTDAPIGIAGVKGGAEARIGENTTRIVLESAHFDAVSTRKTSQRLKLRTDASHRFENGIVPDIAGYGMEAVVKLVLEIAGGTLEGYFDTGFVPTTHPQVSVTLSKLASVLGVAINESDVRGVMEKFGYAYELHGDTLTVTPPFERTDMVIAEDLIEEIGRVYGYEHVPSIVPSKIPVTEINARFYYSDLIRRTLIEEGFSEIYTSSFRDTDVVKMANAFASDKGYLRSSLRKNMDEALAKNAPLADLLGVRQVRAFEIGTVFEKEGERFSLALGVRSPSGFKEKIDAPVLQSALTALETVLGVKVTGEESLGIVEIDLGALLTTLPKPEAYQPPEVLPSVTYHSFSPYPPASRDVAFWAPDTTTLSEIETLIRATAGDLCVRVTLFDEFKKDGRTSYAFRLVFQSKERTLTEDDIVTVMEAVTTMLKAEGFEVR